MTKTPHDALFKWTFGTPAHAVGLLQSMMPAALSAAANWSSLRLCSETLVDTALEEQRTDVRYEVKLGGRRANIYVLLEHQSTSARRMALRMSGYVIRIYERLWEKQTKRAEHNRVLPFVFPLVVHHSKRGWRSPVSMAELLDVEVELREHVLPFVPNLRFALLDLSHEQDERLREVLKSDVAALVGLLLKHAPYDRNFLDRLVHWSELMRRVVRATGGLDAMRSVSAYILKVSNTPTKQLTAMLSSHVDPSLAEIVMSTAERLRAEGRAEGRAKGRAEGRAKGRAEGRAELVLKQLGLRFGELPESAVSAVRAASASELDALAERVLTARSLKACLRPAKGRRG